RPFGVPAGRVVEQDVRMGHQGDRHGHILDSPVARLKTFRTTDRSRPGFRSTARSERPRDPGTCYKRRAGLVTKSWHDCCRLGLDCLFFRGLDRYHRRTAFVTAVHKPVESSRHPPSRSTSEQFQEPLACTASAEPCSSRSRTWSTLIRTPSAW